MYVKLPPLYFSNSLCCCCYWRSPQRGTVIHFWGLNKCIAIRLLQVFLCLTQKFTFVTQNRIKRGAQAECHSSSAFFKGYTWKIRQEVCEAVMTLPTWDGICYHASQVKNTCIISYCYILNGLTPKLVTHLNLLLNLEIILLAPIISASPTIALLGCHITQGQHSDHFKAKLNAV